VSPLFDLKSGHHVIYSLGIRPLKEAKLSEYRTGFWLASEMAAEQFSGRRGRHCLSDLVRILLRYLTHSLKGQSREAYQTTIMDIRNVLSVFPASTKSEVLQRPFVRVLRDHPSHSISIWAPGYQPPNNEIGWFDLIVSWSPLRNEGLRT